jgi:SAM-dependent methyltransferase
VTERELCISFWRGPDAAQRSYEKRWGVWPDPDHISILRRLSGDKKVVEIGCGTGRCAEVFDQWQYTGLDLNPEAIDRARREHPAHDFRVIAWDDPYPPADTYLCHTMLQHVPDAELPGVLERIHGRLVIAEYMVPGYRDRKIYWHRAPEDYLAALRLAGFEVLGLEEYPTAYQPYRPGRGPENRRHFLVARWPSV